MDESKIARDPATPSWKHCSSFASLPGLGKHGAIESDRLVSALYHQDLSLAACIFLCRPAPRQLNGSDDTSPPLCGWRSGCCQKAESLLLCWPMRAEICSLTTSNALMDPQPGISNAPTAGSATEFAGLMVRGVSRTDIP